MFVRKKKNNSGSTSIQIIQKQKGKYKVLKTLGSYFDEKEIENIYRQAQEAIPKLFDQLTLFQQSVTPLHLSELSNDSVRIIGPELIFGKIFNYVGFNTIKDGLFIRTDILKKKGNKIRIIEVKAKSFDPTNDYFFIGKRGGIVSGWKPYLFVLAYQKYVVHKSLPNVDVTAWLMIADKSKQAQVNGLNQIFCVSKNFK